MAGSTRSAALGVLVMVVTALAASGQELHRLRLPSAQDVIRDRIRAEQLLRGGRGPERTLPGEVRDDESVRVKVTPDGTPQEVVVDQRLVLRGVGDYFVKIPGPVQAASPLPDSTSQPGLRSGSLVWQGFATEGELLGARVVLDPGHEQERLPLGVKVDARVDGTPVALDQELPISGLLEVDVSLSNRTAATTEVPFGDAKSSRVAGILDRVFQMLSRGEEPRPGHNIPRSIPVTGAVGDVPVSSFALLTARVVVEFDGKRVVRNAVLSRLDQRHTFHLRARLTGGPIPRIRVRADPGLPPPAQIAPPGAGSWRATARSGATRSSALLRRLMLTLVDVARRPDVDAYLGNPDRDGPATTTYLFEVVPEPITDVRIGAPPVRERASLLGIVAACLLVLLLGAGLIVWWALS